MDLSTLNDLGLSGTEAKVFVALFELKTSTAGAVIDRSGLQNAVVHRAFHSLLTKGFITYVMEGRIKQYQTITTERLLERYEEKKKHLQTLLTELETKQRQRSQAITVTYEGVRGIRELWNMMLTEKTELLSYGAPEEAQTLLRDYFWDAHLRKRKEKGILSRHIFNDSHRTRGEKIRKIKGVQIRFTSAEFEGLTETAISGNKVAIIIYLEQPIGFLIDEKLVAATYKKFFEQLWVQAS